jgi:hypothetical protein
MVVQRGRPDAGPHGLSGGAGMIIRTCQPGDADHEAAVYNAAAARLPGFRPVSADDVRRGANGRFEPGTRYYAEDGGKVVGYATFEPTGRVHYPWCLPGHERLAHMLFVTVLRDLAGRQVPRACASCRADWADQVEFFEDHGFDKVRDVVTFAQSIGDLPTMFQRPGLNVTLARPDDVPAIEVLGAGLLRLREKSLADYLLNNPSFPADAVYVLRKKDGTPQGVGVLIDNDSYPGVDTLDARAPAYWFGAFGTEGLPARRVNGLFSFLAAPGRDAQLVGQDLLWYGTSRMESNSFEWLAAQVSSDAPHLLGFYERYFQKRGTFPVFERAVGAGGTRF